MEETKYATIEKIVALLGETNIFPYEIALGEHIYWSCLTNKQKAEAFDIAKGELVNDDKNFYIGADAYAAAAIEVVKDKKYDDLKIHKAWIHWAFKNNLNRIIRRKLPL